MEGHHLCSAKFNLIDIQHVEALTQSQGSWCPSTTCPLDGCQQCTYKRKGKECVRPLFSKLTAQSCNLYKECKGPTQYTRRHSPTLVPSKSDTPCGSFHLYFENRISLLRRALLGDPKCRNRSVVLLSTLPKCRWQFC